jgi:hypothetical protein
LHIQKQIQLAPTSLSPVLSYQIIIHAQTCQVYILYKYSQLPPCGHPTITDTPPLRTVSKSPAETTMICIGIAYPSLLRTLAITDTLCGRKQKFLLFYFRYGRKIHLTLCYRRIFFTCIRYLLYVSQWSKLVVTGKWV